MARRPTRSTSGGSNRNLYIIGGAIALGVIGLLTILYLNLRGPAPITGLVTFGRQERGHENIEIPLDPLPPVGGIHQDQWQNCGIYRDVLEPANVIHSMEHGAVWITYQDDLPQAEIDQLEAITRQENFIVLSPYPGLQSPVVLTAWQVQLELDGVDADSIEQFIEQYRIGPFTPERGASCSNGVGNPQS